MNKNEVETLFQALRESARPDIVDTIERLVHNGPDRQLNRVNVIDFAMSNGFDEELVIATFLHASRLGLFDMSWNLLCPGCGGVLDANATLKTITQDEYHCALCACGYSPTLDEMIEVSFTVSPRVRRIAAHDPHTLPIWEYSRQIYWSSGIEINDDTFESVIAKVTLDAVEIPAGEQRTLTLQLPSEFLIVFDPVTHTAQFIDVQGETASECQDLAVVFNKLRSTTGTVQMRPGPLRLVLDNHTEQRVLAGIFIAGQALHDMLGHRKRFLTGKRLLTNQTFQDVYRTDMLDVDQRLKITNLTFLFTDIKGSTELYERVGDLVAYDLVRAHFHVLNEVVAAETGAVVKTIGDAVMATFPTPERALAAALRMRDAICSLNDERQREDLLIKIGIHAGPCLAVMLNDRLDYFGQTVNIAARVQGLADSRAIFASVAVVENSAVSALLGDAGLMPVAQKVSLKGIAEVFTVYEIP